MPNLSFAKLWNAYPSTSHSCTQNWPHQCSIRMSIALNHEGSITVQPSTYTEPTCRHGHARGAESLANWLWRYHLGRPKIFNNGTQAKQAIAKNTGIIFFKDCFTRPNSTERSGDHIDLWNRGITKGFSDPNNYASEVWFWKALERECSGNQIDSPEHRFQASTG
ncbi:MAG: hypothetical protein F6K11_18220 [Leptolyngbya sp. SIO3F4]|nr:hypothetical protein [Leptolyngbya sp. SIO3F4]